MKENILEEDILCKEEKNDELIYVKKGKSGSNRKFNYKYWIRVSSISVLASFKYYQLIPCLNHLNIIHFMI